jgi:hypothetical protein
MSNEELIKRGEEIARARSNNGHTPVVEYVPSDPEDDANTESRNSEDEPPRLSRFLLNRSALRDLPKPEPLIEGVLDQGTVALLYGKWGTCKSFIGLDWAASVATGRPWQGRATERKRTLYVAAEGAFGISGRINAWESGWGREIGDGDFAVLSRAVNLTSRVEVRELASLIEWQGYEFVVLDTLARCMVGADENSAKDSGEVVAALGLLREVTPDGRGVVTGIHHTGKDGKTFRGSSVFEAGADTVYSVIRDGAVIVLDREKRKDGPLQDSHRLKLDPIEGTESCVMSSAQTRHFGVERSDRAETLLATFLHHFSTSGATKSELRKVSDLSDGTFYRAHNDLLKGGALVNEGTDKRPFYKAALK